MVLGEEKLRVVLGVIGSDCHAVGNRIIARILEEEGVQVTNLGVMVSQDEFVEAAMEEKADAILVSSIYGHGEIDCAGLRELCIAKGFGRILLYVGGNLVIGKQDFASIERLFTEMGYDRVYSPKTDLRDVVQHLLADRLTRQLPATIGSNSRVAAAI